MDEDGFLVVEVQCNTPEVAGRENERISKTARSRIVSTETLEIDTLQCSNSIVTIVKRQKLFD